VEFLLSLFFSRSSVHIIHLHNLRHVSHQLHQLLRRVSLHLDNHLILQKLGQSWLNLLLKFWVLQEQSLHFVRKDVNEVFGILLLHGHLHELICPTALNSIIAHANTPELFFQTLHLPLQIVDLILFLLEQRAVI
jgi:hypothetical protein